MKNIGIFHHKVGGMDSVALAIDKWKRVLEEMGISAPEIWVLSKVH